MSAGAFFVRMGRLFADEIEVDHFDREALALDLDVPQLLHVWVLAKEFFLICLEHVVAVIVVAEFFFERPMARGPRNFAWAELFGEIFEVAFHLEHF